MVCISIDGDLYDDVEPSKKAINFTFKFLDFLGVKGKVTWFINNDYGWTTTHKKELLKIVDRKEEVGLHVHKINEDVRKGRLSSVYELFESFNKPKKEIEKVVGFRILSFRSGAHAWTPQMFVALENLGVMYDSSIIPKKIIYVDKELYPTSKKEVYNDNTFIKEKEFYMGEVYERTNSKWIYFHPTDLVRKDGTYNMRNIIKFGLSILFHRVFYRLEKVSEPSSFKILWDYCHHR